MRAPIFFVFAMLSHFLTAQISPIPPVGTHWTTARYGMFGLESTSAQGYQATGDSIIDGHSYTRIGDGFFRDSLDVWYCIKSGETEEHLFFDFNLDEGDTMYFHNPFLPEEFPDEYHADYAIVSEVDTVVLLNGEWRKRLHITTHSSTSYDGYDVWAAGIGSLTDMFWLGYLSGILDEGFSELVCFENHNGELLYEDPVPELMGIALQEVIYENCDWHVGIKEHELLDLLIYPNPVDDLLNIQTSQNLGQVSFRILNVYGNLESLIEYTNLDNDQIPTQHLVPGVYILELTTQHETLARRFMKN